VHLSRYGPKLQVNDRPGAVNWILEVGAETGHSDQNWASRVLTRYSDKGPPANPVRER